jgi:hypothetical protein
VKVLLRGGTFETGIGSTLDGSHRESSPFLIPSVVLSGRKLQVSAILSEAAKNARNIGVFAAFFREVFGHPVFSQRRFMKVGLYARVSTHDQQTLPLQLKAMRSYAQKRKWTIAIQVKEVASGATHRPKREELLKAARRR